MTSWQNIMLTWFVLAALAYIPFDYVGVLVATAIYFGVRFNRYLSPGKQIYFYDGFINLAAAIMKADNKPRRSELDYIKKFLRKELSEYQAKQKLSLLRVVLKKNVNVPKICEKVFNTYPHAKRIVILHGLFGVAYADGEISQKEENLLYSIAKGIQINSENTRKIHAMFQSRYQQQDEASWSKEKYNYQWKRSAGSKLSDAYRTLGVSKTTTDSELKRIYRQLAKTHHPDKVAHLGEAKRLAAEKNFSRIAHAYDLVKKHRNLK